MELKEIKLTPRRIELLEKMGIHSVESLLKTYPFRYETIEAVPFDQWEKGQTVCFEGVIGSPARVVRFGKKRSMTKFKVVTWNEELEITLFNRPWANQFPFGKNITIFGTYQGNLKVTANNYNFHPLQTQVGMHPVYTVTQGLKQSEMRTIMGKALEHTEILADVVPERYRKAYKLLDGQTALQWVHNPPGPKHLQAALRTLKYEEFLCFQCVMQATQNKDSEIKKEAKSWDPEKLAQWMDAFPYTLTRDQEQACQDVLADMKSEKIMFRLVQGDVGCGKSMVAFMALYACHLSGWQSAFLAPTEILARQHYENMKQLGLPVILYVSALSAKEKEEIHQKMEQQTDAIFVGTHALFQDSVSFQKLGLVVTDEQQRFGVRQRRALLEKGRNVDFLMMSATPIPRTYAHFLYGNMDLSNIHTMPPGRQPVKTVYVQTTSMKPVLKDVLHYIEQGRQCYVVCPAIDENEEMPMKSVTSIYEGMKKTLKDRVSIGLLHGRMTSEQKEEIMMQFQRKELDILVSTTVIEVGIDIKNATVMVIYDAHRFGLSTLHQLRGRVARGNVQGVCYLLSGSKDPKAMERLQKMEELLDGFTVTDYDLLLRGPGDILGFRQSGLPSFVLGDMEKDKAMMEVCVKDAADILKRGTDGQMLAFIKDAVEKAQYFD